MVTTTSTNAGEAVEFTELPTIVVAKLYTARAILARLTAMLFLKVMLRNAIMKRSCFALMSSVDASHVTAMRRILLAIASC